MSTQYLIIKLRHHGDVLLTTPVIDAIKQAQPHAIIDMLVYAETADMIRDHPNIHRIFVVDRNWKKQGVAHQIQQEYALWRDLKAQHYDVILNLSDQWRTAFLAKTCAKRAIAYYHAHRDCVLWRMCHDDIVISYHENQHMVETHLELLSPLHIPTHHAQLHMAIAPNTRQSLHDKLTQQGWMGQDYILIHPAARWFFKCWDDDKMAQLIQRLLDHGQTIVLTASPDPREQVMLNNICQNIEPPNPSQLYVLSGNLNLRELAAAIDGAKLFIGVDSVPMHMAAALNKTQIALFGATHVFRWRPYSNQAMVICANDYATLPHPDSINTEDPRRLLNAISVDVVWEKVQQCLTLT